MMLVIVAKYLLQYLSLVCNLSLDVMLAKNVS